MLALNVWAGPDLTKRKIFDILEKRELLNKLGAKNLTVNVIWGSKYSFTLKDDNQDNMIATMAKLELPCR